MRTPKTLCRTLRDSFTESLWKPYRIRTESMMGMVAMVQWWHHGVGLGLGLGMGVGMGVSMGVSMGVGMGVSMGVGMA